MQFLIGPKALIYIYWWAQGSLYTLNLLEFKHTLLFISVMAEYALPSMNPTHLLQQGFTLWVLNTSFWPESTPFVANFQRKKLSCFFLSNNAHVIALFATWWRYNVAYFWIFWEQLYYWWTFGLLIKMSPFIGFPHCFRSYCFYMLKEKWQPERWWKSIYIVKRVQRLFSFERVYNLDSISEIREVVEFDFKK